MLTIPSPAFSRWVRVTVAASPEATAMPGEETQEILLTSFLLGTRQIWSPLQCEPNSLFTSRGTLTVLGPVQRCHRLFQTVSCGVSAATVLISLHNNSVILRPRLQLLQISNTDACIFLDLLINSSAVMWRTSTSFTHSSHVYWLSG